MIQALATDLHLTAECLQWLWQIAVLCAPLVLVQALQGLSGDLSIVLKLSGFARATAYSALLLMLVALGSFGGKEFIYFQF